MTCIRIQNGIICVNPWGRVRIGNRYVWIDYHTYCGPSFWWNSAMTKEYEPKDENDPIWPEFEKWLKRYEAQKAKVGAGRTVLHNARSEPTEPLAAKVGSTDGLCGIGDEEK